jgi:uncharacterized protein (TIGR03435 family)
VSTGGVKTVRAHATTMTGLVNLISAQLGDAGDRPVVDRTGFAGYFNIDDLTFAPLTAAASAADSNAVTSDVPSLGTASKKPSASSSSPPKAPSKSSSSIPSTTPPKTDAPGYGFNFRVGNSAPGIIAGGGTI